ncbi:hypothetical protein K6973_01665 [Streptococcus dysgalactiae]|uniref:hypothetical protein n=1 Tax=Streptococcus dysgalactiae TaxID=1334 RepID=UPI001C9DDB37|nr:hypothetical protein [Streptococcus dysgalactiae]QZT27494.1 hypothetical protein K6973_01665 [Streptococcus dysgalactiae]
MDKLIEIIDSIWSSKKSDNYFAMLTSSVVLIDICASIEFHSNNYKPYKRYQKWVEDAIVPLIVEKNLTEYLEPVNFWFLRNSLLHEGSSNPNSNDQYQNFGEKKVRDIVPIANSTLDTKAFLVNDGFEYPVLMFDVVFFTELVCEAANYWIKKNEEKIQAHSDNLFSIALMANGKDGKALIMRKK